MWNSIQCAVQGRGHLKTGTPCQDKTYYMNENGVNVISLADGAGSAKMSHFGAEFITKSICKLLTDKFDIFFNKNDGVETKRDILQNLISGLEDLSGKYASDIKEFAATLLVVAVHDDKYIIIHIGDGVIGYVKNSELKIASYPENGEFINTTVFVTSKEAFSTMKLLKGRLDGISGFILMSDGSETSLYNKRDKKLAPAVKKLFDLSQTMILECLQFELEKSFENVIRNTTTDDCSLILIVEESNSFSGYKRLTENQRKEILGINNFSSNGKRIKRYDEILDYLSTPKNLSQISKKLFLKEKYCRKHLNLLLSKNMIVYKNGKYSTAIILEK